MGFDELFEHHDKHRSHGSYGKNSYNHDDYDYAGRSSEYYLRKYQFHDYLLNKIWSNKKLRVAVIVLVIILVLIVILLIVALIPLLFKLLDYIMQNGVQGIFSSITSFVEKLWNGTGK